MKKIVVSILAVFLISLSVGTFAAAEGEPQTPKVNLTEEQKSELAKLHEQMYSTKRELVKKYVEYGVFSKEQGDNVLKMMEAKYQKLKENDYMMRWHPHPHHGKKLDHKE